ncbi:MAG: IgGFc-binding protein [Anaerolineae bacterium]|nr:IgGFc-binding protein [Anaerolineae bacterium]
MFKKIVHLLLCTAAGSLLTGGWLATQAQAQTGRRDEFTFFIPFRSENILAQFKAGNNLVAQETDLSLQTNLSIPINRSGTVIYYDHWEDGYEAELTLPTQNSTQVWGDGNPANGVAPTIRNQAGGDSLLADDVIVLNNRVLLPGGGRDQEAIYYDGGDVLTALGGSVAVTEVIWPLAGDTDVPGSLYTDAWEIYPTSRWGQTYYLPVGEDLAGLREGFRVVGLNVQAGQNDTTVTITNRNGAVKTSATLNYGEELSLPTGMAVGDQIQASAPVQVQLFTADPTRDYEERGGTLVPLEQWRTDYLAPRSAEGDFWLYNPQTSPLTITVTMSNTVATVTVPPGQTARYSNNGANLSTATGARFQANAPFYGLVALDAHEARDWGYSLQPVESLTPQILIGWAPGNNRTPPTGQGNYSPVYVTALTNTTVTLHFADSTPDTTVSVPALAEVAITSPTDDMTGALLYTTDGTPFLAVWGERPDAPVAQPSIDAGSNIVPLSSLALQKSFHLRDSLDCSGSINTGDTVRFTLQYFNNAAFGGNLDITVVDDLPPELTYIPGSSQLDGTTISDGPGGLAPFSSAAGGVVAPATQGGSGRLTFDAILANDVPAVENRAEASAPLLGSATASLVLPFDQEVRPILQIDKRLLDPASGPATWGQVITFGVTITNTSSQVTITQLALHDTFAATDLTFLQASPPPDIVTEGALTWTNLVSVSAFAPNQTINLITTFRVKPVPPTTTEIINQADFDNVQNDDGLTRIVCTTATQVNIVAPPPTATAAPTATSTPPATPTSRPTAPPNQTPQPGPTASPHTTPTSAPVSTLTAPPPPPTSGTPTSTMSPNITIISTGTVIPVNLLPETGEGYPPRWPLWVVLLLLGLGVLSEKGVR